MHWQIKKLWLLAQRSHHHNSLAQHLLPSQNWYISWKGLDIIIDLILMAHPFYLQVDDSKMEASAVFLQADQQGKVPFSRNSNVCSCCSFSPWYFCIFSCSFLMLLSTVIDTSITSCSLMTLLIHHYIWLFSQLLICLEFEVPQDLSHVVFNYLWWRLPLETGDF